MAAAFAGNDELWRECASWLTRFGVLRPDHRANLETSSISDLANTLRDGVLLCNLLNKLDPGCIDSKDFNQKPQLAQFLCSKNIQLFLTMCRDRFGLKESDLFEHSMLFHFSNFHQVLVTLSALSQSPKAQFHQIDGFSAQVEKNVEEDEIYQSLKSVNTTPETLDRLEVDDGVHRNDEIYQDLCVLRRNTMQAQQPLEKRDYVITELINTENNYVEVLKKIKKCYVDRFANSNKMTPEDHAKIFGNISEILLVHKELRNQLLKLNTDKSVKLSAIIMNFREKFLIYGQFCSNLTDATITLQEICDKDENITAEIDKADFEANNGKFKLRDLLQVPMQRILKYHLILDKLVEATDPNHDEFKDLKRAREAMLDINAYINEMARDKEVMNILQQVSENMVWEQGTSFAIESCGRLKKDGEVKVKMHADPRLKTRYAFIFDKFMFLTKPTRNNQFQYRTRLDLAEFRLDEANNRALLNQGVRWSYQWHMVKHDKSIVYSMSVKTAEIKEVMIKAIHEAIDNVRPAACAKTNHKFEMNTYKSPTTCHKCSKYLKGQIYQGYLCRVCNISVHKECITTSGRCGVPPALPSSPSCTWQESIALQSKLWFAGEKGRGEASILLENRKAGTFLVRIRLNSDTDRYALSLKTIHGVKHMKICSNCDGYEQKYYLSISRFFNSLEEMVSNYQQASLKENFERLEEDAKLEYPYRQIKAEATRNFSSPNFAFEKGETVVIIEKEERGWCKGITRTGAIGKFPGQYVNEKEEITYDAF